MGITFHRIGQSPDLPDEPMPAGLGLGFPKPLQESFKHPTNTTDAKPACFVDAVRGNSPTKRRSTTGCAMTHCGGATLCQSKAQSATALSLTEAKLTILPLHPPCTAVKGNVTCFTHVFVTGQCLQFIGCASTLWIGGVGISHKSGESESWMPADVAVCPPSVRCPSPLPWTDSGIQRLTQPQIKPMTSDLRFLIHPPSH